MVSDLPSFLTFMQAIDAGKVNLSDAKVQQQFGFVFLNTAASMMNEAYKHSYELLRKAQ